MKKSFLSLAIVLSSYCSYAQTYLPLSAGDNNPLTGPLYVNTSNDNWVTGLNIHNSANSNASRTGITLTNDANNILLLYKQASSNSDPNDNILYSVQGNFRLYTGGNEAIRVAENGKVDIGTTSPSRKLDVLSGSGVTPLAAVGPNGYILIDNTGAGYNYYSASMLHEFQIGGTAQMDITSNGNVLIGKTTQNNTAYKLDVNGSARANEVVVNTTGADFVFDKQYTLPKLLDVKAYIDKNQHLPEIPSAKEMQTNGMNVGEINTKLLQKVEELTLYLIEKDKQLMEQQKKNDEYEARMAALEKALLKLTEPQSK